MAAPGSRPPAVDPFIRTGQSGGASPDALATMFAIARSRRPGSTSIRGSVSGTSTTSPRPPSGRLASAFGTTSSNPTTSRTSFRAPT